MRDGGHDRRVTAKGTPSPGEGSRPCSTNLESFTQVQVKGQMGIGIPALHTGWRGRTPDEQMRGAQQDLCQSPTLQQGRHGTDTLPPSFPQPVTPPTKAASFVENRMTWPLSPDHTAPAGGQSRLRRQANLFLPLLILRFLANGLEHHPAIR